MDFCNLSDTQQAVQKLAMDFAKSEIIPNVESLESAGVFPKELQRKALESGLLNVVIPEEFGGPGLGYLDFCLITESLGWACPGVAGALSLNNMIADAVMIAGTQEQKNTYLRRLVAGEVGAYALTEPGAGSDVGGIQLRAEKVGEEFVLNGSKTWISNAAVASFIVVFAKTNMSAGSKGITAFLVERKSTGVRVGNNLPKLGQKAFPASEIFFEDVRVPVSSMLGQENQGFLVAMKVFDRSRPMVGALATGLAQRCLDESIKYAKTRTSMGKAIATHQLVAHKIAEMGMRVEASRLLTWKAADLLDQGKKNTLCAAYSKTFASDTAAWASSEAIQIFGGMGYSPEYPVEKLYRDSKVLQIYEGTNEIQRLIMARELTSN